MTSPEEKTKPTPKTRARGGERPTQPNPNQTHTKNQGQRGGPTHPYSPNPNPTQGPTIKGRGTPPPNQTPTLEGGSSAASGAQPNLNLRGGERPHPTKPQP